jgi:hypothetical protein
MSGAWVQPVLTPAGLLTDEQCHFISKNWFLSQSLREIERTHAKAIQTSHHEQVPNPFPNVIVRVAPRKRHYRPVPVLRTDTAAPTVQLKVDYSSYRAKDLNVVLQQPEQIFDGIMHYIYLQSGQCYNVREVSIAYAGIQPNSDPANILDPSNFSCYESESGIDQCVVITFHRIQVRPTALVLRSAPSSAQSMPRFLKAFVFQGWDDSRQRWVTLTENLSFCNWHPSSKPMAASCFCNVDTCMELSKFRILQTERNQNAATPFSLSALEIHGSVRLVHAPEASTVLAA